MRNQAWIFLFEDLGCGSLTQKRIKHYLNNSSVLTNMSACAAKGFRSLQIFIFMIEWNPIFVPSFVNQNSLYQRKSVHFFFHQENVLYRMTKKWAAHNIKVSFLFIMDSSQYTETSIQITKPKSKSPKFLMGIKLLAGPNQFQARITQFKV